MLTFYCKAIIILVREIQLTKLLILHVEIYLIIMIMKQFIKHIVINLYNMK